MPKITFQGQDCSCNENETVLDCLSRHGLSVPSSCRSGICQTCLMRSVEGAPTTDSQKGLSTDLQRRNFFLACSCVPQVDMNVALPEESDAPHFRASILDKQEFTPRMLRLRLARPEGFTYEAGQFINLSLADGTTRSYSLASLPEMDYLEFHVQRVKDGKVSGWLFDRAQVGDELTISEAMGDCTYRGQPDQPLLLLATGSGLAPVWAVLQQALAAGHRGRIALYHGSSESDGLYLRNELTALAQTQPHFSYTAALSKGEAKAGIVSGRVLDLVLNSGEDFKGWRAYLAGHPAMVNDARKKLFLAGVAFSDIHADPFEHQ